MAQLKTENARLQSKNEGLSETVQRQNSHLADLQKINDAKDEQLKIVNQAATEMLGQCSSMSCDEIKEHLRKIIDMLMPDYLPSPEEETTKQQRPVTASVLNISPFAQGNAGAKKNPPGPNAGQRKSVTLHAIKATTTPTN